MAETYRLKRLSENDGDKKILWRITHKLAHGAICSDVIRSGTSDALYWIEIHQQVCK